jgi:Glycosyl hydrolases family 2, TIM barrel domain/Glycosyl hydrolases family 2, sugar binding domain/Glycosyl hydrolases family 2/Beta galactosidase small chain
MLRQCLLALFFCGAVVVSACAQGGGPQTQVRYLSGTGKDDAVMWDFFCTSGRKAGVWTKIAVPSNWEQQGFGDYNYGRDRVSETNPLAREQGKYRLRFRVPAGWKEKLVRLVFDGVMTDAEVFINGKTAGPIHQGSFYRFKYDITPLLRFGETNLLEVTVSKVSANESVNRAERFNVDYWVFGGIFRPVYLEALPEQFIDWTAIDALADGSLTIDAHLGARATAQGKVTAQILDERGAPVGEPFDAGVAPGQDSVRLRTKTAGPRLWTAETPNLYRVRLTLSQAKPLHTVSERFGFRTFEVRAGDGLYLNGRKITLKGTNRHSFWPETGRTTSRRVSYEDVRLMKEMNNNAVRMSHYPPDEHFLEACDELGLYVLDELGGWHHSYDTPTGQRLIGEMVRRDVNHPSILFWDNGNEGGWNRENDDEFARWDIQKRAVLHPWELFRGVNTDHYETYSSHMKLSMGQDIYLPTEFLHGLYDGGAGAGLWDYWELTLRSKTRAGGFLWAFVDECIARTDRQGQLDCAGNQGPDGIVGPHREREGSFNTVREIWSPVQVLGPQTWPDDFRGAVTVENRYDFINLKECRFDWQLARFPSPDEGGAGHKAIVTGSLQGPDVEPHEAGQLMLKLPAGLRKSDALYLTAKDPAGRELWTWAWELRSAAEFARQGSGPAAGNILTSEEGGLLLVQTGSLELRFSKETGRLLEVRRDGLLFPFGDGPRFLAFRRNDRKYADVAGQSTLKHFALRRDGADLIVEATYDGALTQTRWRIAPGGLVRLDYEYEFDGAVDIIGVRFELAEQSVKGIRWLGMGPYRVWQNRMQGARLDVWENSYNDTTPGESWAYPEFKGYFRDWRWAEFETTEGKIIIASEAKDSFLGVYRPKDGKDGLLEFPETGIAFLEVIPAMRSKNHSPSELGPQSQQKQVNGITRRTVHLRFSAE